MTSSRRTRAVLAAAAELRCPACGAAALHPCIGATWCTGRLDLAITHTTLPKLNPHSPS